VYISELNKKSLLTYTTHDIVNQLIGRFTTFCLFFDEDFMLTPKDEKIAQRIVLKILHKLNAERIISRRLTYECDKDIKSIYIYSFKAEINLKYNLQHLNISLVGPTIFINNKTPYAKTYTYLSVNRIMLVGEGNLKEFKLKDLNLLHKLFSTKYVFDDNHYCEIYEHILEATPLTLIEDLCD
jgi:hypothetical protein